MLTILIGVVVVFMIAVASVALAGRRRRNEVSFEEEIPVTDTPPAADEAKPGRSAVASSDEVNRADQTTPTA